MNIIYGYNAVNNILNGRWFWQKKQDDQQSLPDEQSLLNKIMWLLLLISSVVFFAMVCAKPMLKFY